MEKPDLKNPLNGCVWPKLQSLQTEIQSERKKVRIAMTVTVLLTCCVMCLTARLLPTESAAEPQIRYSTELCPLFSFIIMTTAS